MSSTFKWPLAVWAILVLILPYDVMLFVWCVMALACLAWIEFTRA